MAWLLRVPLRALGCLRGRPLLVLPVLLIGRSAGRSWAPCSAVPVTPSVQVAGIGVLPARATRGHRSGILGAAHRRPRICSVGPRISTLLRSESRMRWHGRLVRSIVSQGGILSRSAGKGLTLQVLHPPTLVLETVSLEPRTRARPVLCHWNPISVWSQHEAHVLCRPHGRARPGPSRPRTCIVSLCRHPADRLAILQGLAR